jgi:26S proteasome regulatory subunit N4
MGLPLKMSNLHAPTVPSGPTSTPVANGTPKHLSFGELQQKKDNTEAELKALSGVLDSVSLLETFVMGKGLRLGSSTASI